MYRILLCRLAILLGFFSSTNLALAQVHPAQPHQLTFAEARGDSKCVAEFEHVICVQRQRQVECGPLVDL